MVTCTKKLIKWSFIISKTRNIMELNICSEYVQIFFVIVCIIIYINIYVLYILYNYYIPRMGKFTYLIKMILIYRIFIYI